MQLAAGMVVGFLAGGPAHLIRNDGDAICAILEVGDRSRNNVVSYPMDDIRAVMGGDGKRQLVHKDGTPY